MRYWLFLLLFLPFYSYAADQNGYTAQYECKSGGANCNVDVATYTTAACDQTITAAAAWSTINWSNNVICLQNGDHTAKGTLTLGSSGTSGTRKVLRYTRSVDNDDEPWNQGTNQAKVHSIAMNGRDYWIIHRLTFPARSGPGVMLSMSSTNTTNLIVNRSYFNGGSSFAGQAIGDFDSTTTDFTLQNSVVYLAGPTGPGVEAVGVSLCCGSNLRIVNSELYDWVSHPIQVGLNHIPILTGIVVENNDIYLSPSLQTQGGTKGTESPLSLKVSGTSGSHVLIIQNRIWGARPTDFSVCCDGEDGNAVTFFNQNEFVLLQNNIIFDSQIGINNTSYRTSYIGNIFWKISAYDTGTGSVSINSWDTGGTKTNYELYLNSFISNGGNSLPDMTDTNSDAKCNVIIDSGPKVSGTPGSGTVIDYNVYYGTTDSGETNKISKTLSTRANSTSYSQGAVVRTTATPPENGTAGDFLYMKVDSGTESSGGSAPTWCTTLGCTVTDGDVTWQAVRGPYSFYRKLKTGPEQMFIPYAKVHTSAAESNPKFCPSGFASTSGRGVDNTQP